jgi:hypothetical protein
MASIASMMDLVEEFHASGLTRNELREKRLAEGISISSFHVWFADYISGRLQRCY